MHVHALCATITATTGMVVAIPWCPGYRPPCPPDTATTGMAFAIPSCPGYRPPCPPDGLPPAELHHTMPEQPKSKSGPNIKASNAHVHMRIPIMCNYHVNAGCFVSTCNMYAQCM